MRIAHVVRQFHPAVGGMEEVVAELAAAQVASGHSVRVVTLDRIFDLPEAGQLPSRDNLGEVEICRVPFSGSRRYPLAWRTLRHIKDADIVHVHGLDFFFDYLAWTSFMHRRTLVVSTHGGYFHTPYAAGLKRLYFGTVTRFSLSRYAAVATVSAADNRLFNAVRWHGITLIENGVNVAKYAAAAPAAPLKTAISLSRFSSNKRLDRLIEFIAALRRRDPQWTLKIAGRPSDLSASDLESMTKAAGVAAAVKIFVSPDQETIRSLIARASVFVSASEYEGFGLTAIEGMSAGLFPVLSDIPPFRDLIERSKVGALIDFTDAEGAAEKFLEIWSNVAPHYAAARRAAMQASARYDWDRVRDQYEALYQSARGTKVRSILDVAVGVSTYSEAARLLDERFRRGDPSAVIFANAHTLNHASDTRVREAFHKAIVFNDGVGVDLASRLLFGRRFPENMNGTDFVPRYLRQTSNRYRIFLLGAKPGIAERAARQLARMAPRHTIAGHGHGYFDAAETAGMVETIRRSRADILLIAMGNPKQELWLSEHLAETGCRLGFGVGGLFDFLAGAVPRAPEWVRSAHLEWLYRMLQEPRRLSRRYLVGMPLFFLRVLGQWVGGARVPDAIQDRRS